MIKPPLLIRADADARMGNGHLMRCFALAQQWQSEAGEVAFVSYCESARLRQRIEAAGMDFTEVSKTYPNRLDLETTLERLARLKDGHAQRTAPRVVLDGYHFDEHYQQAIKSAGYPLLVLDDTVRLKHYYADALLNQNLNAEQLAYQCDPETELLLGARFVLLRPEFMVWRAWRRDVPDVARKLLITMGGADPDNVTYQVLRAVQHLTVPDLEAVVLVGANNPHYEALQKFVADSQPIADQAEGQKTGGIRLVRDAHNVPDLMAWADLAVTAGGSTCWEMAFMGLPSITLILADNQSAIAENLHEAGAVVNAGWHDKVTLTSLVETLELLIADAGKRRRMSERGRTLVDGLGAERVAHALTSQWRESPVNI
ncbi:MAG: UDP-2,4-diacetamido-2,4,6-trideoxy-beta-L-altropyranose hydrolase [Pyrinomonadaceae bacterium]